MKRSNLFWQVLTGTAVLAVFALFLIWLVRGVAPAASVNTPTALSLPADTATPAPDEPTPTTVPDATNYDWHGVKLFRTVDFPQSPNEANIYTHSTDTPATIDFVQKLAQRFGIQGQVYLFGSAPSGSQSFLVTDGKQRLTMSSDGQFSYYADFSTASIELPVPQDVAAGAVETFFKAHGFDFAYQLQAVAGIGAGWFYVVPLSLDQRPLLFDFGLIQGFTVHVSPDGKIVSLDAFLLKLDPQPVGSFGLISAEDAWQKFLGDASPGILQSGGGSVDSARMAWQHIYPDNQPETVYGFINSFESAEAGQAPLISVDGYPVSGNTAGMEKLSYNNTFAQVRGQFYTENDIRKFKVDAWQVHKDADQKFLQGNLKSAAGKVIFVSDGNSYTLTDAPADLPVPLENINLVGMLNGKELDWQSIYYFKDSGHSGGGGCGGSFYSLNLTGKPVVWPTVTPAVTPTALPAGQQVGNIKGLLSVTIYMQTDGSQRAEYGLSNSQVTYILQGQGLEPLQAYNNRLVTVSGTVTGYNQYQLPLLSVEHFDIPNPDVKFQIVRGTQKSAKLDGKPVILFTTQSGTTYVQMMPVGVPDSSLVLGKVGDLVELEALIYSDEVFAGYPAMRIFGGQMAINPKTGQPADMKITADQPQVMPEPEPAPASEPVPTLTIDGIDLVYYTPNPRYATDYPDAMSPYIQPVWRFTGHYSDGSQTEILVQALKVEYLLPEAAPALQCG
jgi:hypothetical protein